ncbi:MAG: ABC transporter ATP-binding protein [Candidatus Bipolaricaulota bacterium]|nr:ABC transporter ATP-binding protein [Candidatus Bipolaricaulota bacterium]MCS7274692.1 ABC transporter ATP-binding protein [Candidatus Bipolaricaulota bacterium]MDW8111374.1 ABC transporter ATP-binding protein [Candidatus Bipolaricaulota bacterium]
MNSEKLKIVGLTKSFSGPQLPVLDEITLSVGAGELVALLGPSGCGKTTLLNIVAGVFPPDRGELYLDGQRVAHCQQSVAYLPQRDLLLPWRTVLDNALLGCEIVAPQESARARAEAQRYLSEFGLEGFERYYPAQLSGGMRTRVALIRTLLTPQRELWLLDEPFAALDALTRAQLHQMLLQLWHSAHKTVLFVTHDLEEALLLSDRICLLTARPARVKTVIENKLSRPRDPVSSEFVALKRSLWDLVRAEL